MSAVKKVKIDADAVKPEDDKIEQRIEAADKIQQEIENIHGRMTDELLKLEVKYDKEKRPYYIQRSEQTSKIPHFWLTVFENSEICDAITDEDKEVLKHLIDVDCVDNADYNTGYKIHFKFEKNPYFENDVLTKEYSFEDNDNHNRIIVISNKIKWKPGKDLTIPHKPEDKGNKRTIDEIRQGFFNWFTSTEEDDIGGHIKENIFLNPLNLYAGVGPDELGEDDDDDDYIRGEDEAEEADDDK